MKNVAPPATCPLILLPGMGTDARLFTLQKTEFPQVLVPEWPTPLRQETLASYAARLAESLAIRGPCVVGGVSFGGLVALELTRHLDARACVLISSLRHPRQLPLWARLASPAAWLMPSNADRIVSAIASLTLRGLRPVLPSAARGFLTHVSKTRASILPWACRATVSWKVTADWPCPIYQLHGANDPIFPLRFVQREMVQSMAAVIPGGGHLLTLTHPFVVNQFLHRHLDQWLTTPHD